MSISVPFKEEHLMPYTTCKCTVFMDRRFRNGQGNEIRQRIFWQERFSHDKPD